jgi:hypothetical protein
VWRQAKPCSWYEGSWQKSGLWRPPPLPRPFGLGAGRFIVPADFDRLLPDDILKEFEGA